MLQHVTHSKECFHSWNHDFINSPFLCNFILCAYLFFFLNYYLDQTYDRSIFKADLIVVLVWKPNLMTRHKMHVDQSHDVDNVQRYIVCCHFWPPRMVALFCCWQRSRCPKWSCKQKGFWYKALFVATSFWGPTFFFFIIILTKHMIGPSSRQ